MVKLKLLVSMKMRTGLVSKLNIRKQIWIGQKRAITQRPSEALWASEGFKIKVGNRGTILIVPIFRSV